MTIKYGSKSLQLSLLFSVLFLLFPSIISANSSPTLISNTDLARVPKDTELIDSDYAIIGSFTSNTEVIYDISQPDYNDDHAFFFDRRNSDKGRIQARYTNVSSHKGRSLDLRFTVLDWKKDSFGGGESMNFTENNTIGFRQSGYQRVTIKMEYIYSDTLKPATDITGSYMTFSDFDMFQSMAFTNSELNKFHDMFVYNPTEVYTWKVNDGGVTKTHIGSQDRLNRNADDTKGWVTGLIKSHELTFDWAKDYSEWNSSANSGRPYNKVPIDRDRIDAGGSKYNRNLGDVPQERFEYVSEKPLRTDTPEPTKTIPDSKGVPIDRELITEPGGEFTYDIHHIVPYETSNHWYTSYVIEDDIDSALNVRSVKVYDHNGDNVSGKFNITANNNQVKVVAKNSSLNSQSFYGQIYKVSIDVKVKDAKALGSNKAFVINNTAKVVVDNSSRYSKNSNPTTTPVKIIEKPKKDVSKSKIEPKESFEYNVTHRVPNEDKQFYYTEYTMKDSIDKALDIEGVRVYDKNNNDVTNRFNIRSNNNNIEATATSNALSNSNFYNQNYRFNIKVSAKNAETLIRNNNSNKSFTVSNSAYITVDHQSSESNDVDTDIYLIQKPDKEIVNSSGSGLTENQALAKESFAYNIRHVVPNEDARYYYASYTIEDTIHESLRIKDKDVKVYDKAGKDVTNKFNIAIGNHNVVKLTAKNNVLNAKDFYGVTYRVNIPVEVINEDSLIDLTGGKNIHAENTAKVTVNAYSKDSNTVRTSIKSAFAPKKDVSVTEVTSRESFEYEITHRVPAEDKTFYYSSYVITDEIHDALKVDDVTVHDKNNNNVTNRFTINTNSNNVTVSATSNALSNSNFYNQEYRVTIHTTVKNTASLMTHAGENNKTFDIENIAKVNVEGVHKSSNKTNTEVVLPTTELIMGKIQIYTNKSDDGLPLRLDIEVEGYEEAYGDQEIELDVVNESNNSVLSDTVTVTLDDLENTIGMLVTKGLSVDSVKDYTAVIKDYNDAYLNADDDVDSIDTEGHTAKESIFTETMFKGIVMTERELNKDMTKFHEEIKVDYGSTQNVKSGYGFTLDIGVSYTNELLESILNDFDEIDIGLTTGVTSYVDSQIIDETFDFDTSGGTTMIDLDYDSSIDYINNKVNMLYRIPQVYMNTVDRTFVLDDGTTNYDTDMYEDAGNKLYVPVWIDELGSYDLDLISDRSIGSHHMTFDLDGSIDVVAYMFHHIDSETPDKDEILLRSVNSSDD